jgi:hypothetical protein
VLTSTNPRGNVMSRGSHVMYSHSSPRVRVMYWQFVTSGSRRRLESESARS